MTDLFNTKDLLTVATADQAVVGTKGFFGDNLSNLIVKVKQGKVETLTDVTPDVAYCFESNDDLHYVFFLPIDKVEKPYRALESREKSFNLFLPADKVKEVEENEKKWRAFEDFNEFKIWTGKSVGSVIVYKDKLTNDELEAVITRSKLYEDFVEIGAVEYTFKELFDQWEWLNPRNEWVPFGVKK
ncbi:MAG: hypothetical protein SPL83_02070 [Succinivibrio sp.]|nr:hypothetical protein [Succinivibrio sp.]